MNLYLNDTSPFSRAVLATAYLCNAPLNLKWVDPWQTPQALLMINPFSTIPVLETADGVALSESLIICEFLMLTYPTDALSVIKANDTKRMSLLGLSKTLMEVSFRCAALSRFDAEQNILVERGKKGIQRCVQAIIEQLLNGTRDLLKSDFSTLYLHIALDYVLFRHSSLLSEKRERDSLDCLTRLTFQRYNGKVEPQVAFQKLSYNEYKTI